MGKTLNREYVYLDAETLTEISRCPSNIIVLRILNLYTVYSSIKSLTDKSASNHNPANRRHLSDVRGVQEHICMSTGSVSGRLMASTLGYRYTVQYLNACLGVFLDFRGQARWVKEIVILYELSDPFKSCQCQLFILLLFCTVQIFDALAIVLKTFMSVKPL